MGAIGQIIHHQAIAHAAATNAITKRSKSKKSVVGPPLVQYMRDSE